MAEEVLKVNLVNFVVSPGRVDCGYTDEGVSVDSASSDEDHEAVWMTAGGCMAHI